MRLALLALTAALALLPAQDRDDPPQSPPVDVGPGCVAWFDITATDLAKAREFYGKLLDWTFTPLAQTDLAVEIVARGTPIGTLRVAEGPISAFNGVVYVQVADVQASCSRAAELGGAVAPGFPFDLPDGKGAIALALDPSGHPVGLYSKASLAAEKPAGR